MNTTTGNTNIDLSKKPVCAAASHLNTGYSIPGGDGVGFLRTTAITESVSIPETGIRSLLEYLIFSGTPINLTTERAGKGGAATVSACLSELADDCFEVTIPDINAQCNQFSETPNWGFSVSYRRAGARFSASLLGADLDKFRFAYPRKIELVNRRRTRRELFTTNSNDAPDTLSLSAMTSIGRVQLRAATVHDFSQTAIGLFVSRKEALLLPGDKIESVNISFDGKTALISKGVVIRTDMGRTHPHLPHSYLVVIGLATEGALVPSSSPIERRAPRITVSETHPCYLTLKSPLFSGKQINAQIVEISANGLSAIVEPTELPILPGLGFPDAEIQIPYSTRQTLTLKVVYTKVTSETNNPKLKIGCQFENGSVGLLREISAYDKKISQSPITDLTEKDLDIFWQFLFETNFIYSNKRAFIQKQSAEVIETYRKILTNGKQLVRKIAYKEQGLIKGHLCLLRFFDRAYIFQHLAASQINGGSAAKAVLGEIIDFFMNTSAQESDNAQYAVAFYRPENLYPAILFGKMAERIDNENIASVYNFNYGVIKQSLAELVVNDGGFRIDDLTSTDRLLQTLLDKKMYSYIRSFGLDDPSFPEQKIDESYSSAGLLRQRHLVEYRVEGKSLFAIVEMASAGLNLSELTNSITLFDNGIPQRYSAIAHKKLLAFVNQNYFLPRGATPVVLTLNSQGMDDSIDWKKTYSCWIFSLKHPTLFKNQTNDIFSNFRRLAVEHRKKNNVVPIKPPLRNYGTS
jgi:hypothetical protein